MKLQVDCDRHSNPRLFFLGKRQLRVMRVLERAAENSQRRFRVRVADGREFVLRHDLETGAWRLARVHAAKPARRRS